VSEWLFGFRLFYFDMLFLTWIYACFNKSSSRESGEGRDPVTEGKLGIYMKRASMRRNISG